MPDIAYYTIGTIQYNLKDLVSRERISTLENWVASAIDMFYPIGSVIINLGVNPGTYLEGTTWVRTAVGKAIVGVDPSNTLMDSAEDIFGSANSTVPAHSHTASSSAVALTANSAGAHTHNFSAIQRNTAYEHLKAGDKGYPTQTKATTSAGAHSHSINAHSHSITVNSAGVNATNKNYQPSMAFYIWKRTA